MTKHLKITEQDWGAISKLVDVGLDVVCMQKESIARESGYYRDYVQWKSVTKRINMQLDRIERHGSERTS